MAGAGDSTGTGRPEPDPKDPEQTLVTNLKQPRPGRVDEDSGLAETIRTPPPPAGGDTVLTALSDETIKTPPPGLDDTLATRAGFQADHTLATAAPGGSGGSGGEPTPGEIWGDYRFEGLLGRGGMGAVFSGRQLSLDRPVAIKVLPQHLGHNADFRQRFVLEARSVARISSPHVIQVYAAGEHQGSLYFAMEYVEGEDLSARIKAGYRPDPREALELVLQAARGLAAAGDLGIVHRDIKPSNMMVTADHRLKIMDFGLVKMTKDTGGLTMAGTVMGTVTYFSPEQGRGDPIDHRTDIYALGVVFYELLAGKLPFTGEDPSSIIYQHLHAEPRPPREINPSVPEAYQAVVLKSMQKDPENRYQDAHALIADLEAVRDGAEPKTAMIDPQLLRSGATIIKPDQFSQERKQAKQKSGGGALVALVALALLSVGAWWAYTRYGDQLLGRDQLSGHGLQAGGQVTDGSELSRAQRLLERGELDTVRQMVTARQAAGALDPGWQAVADHLRAAQADAIVEQARSALAAGDGVAAAQAIERLAAVSEGHGALDQLRAQVQDLRAAKAAIATATTALAAGWPQEAMAALAAVSTADLPDSQREQVATFNSHARAVAQLLNAASEALERQDLDTARQSFLEAFQRYENQTASQGLKAVSLAKQFNDALAKGDLSAAGQRLAELDALDRFPGLADARRAEYEVASQAEAVEQALKTQDFAAAEAALARLGELAAGSRRIGELQHQVTLQRHAHAFERALQAQDLDVATAALAAIKDHDGERETWRQAGQRLAASRLQENAKASRIAEREQVVRSLLAVDRPDFSEIDAAVADFVAEAGDAHPGLQSLRREIAARRSGLAIAATLRALDQAVLGGQADRVQALVTNDAHAEALTSLIGQEGLELEHRVVSTEVDADQATVEVDLRTAMKVYPEATIRYRYRMQRGGDGWLVIAAERLARQ